ncbi:MAG: Ig-like domain-containing protein [Patescibacteria group bacterium]|jgi:hypothetical protein
MNTSLLRSIGARFAALAVSFSLLAPLPIHAASSAISIGIVSPTSATVGIPATLQASVSSSAGSIASCNLYVDNDDKGAMNVAAGKATLAYAFNNSQVYTVFVFCRDSVNNFNSGMGVAVWAQGGSGGGGGGDINPPVVSSVSPASAEVGKTVSLSVTVSDAGGVSSCELFVDSQSQGMMTISQGVASKSYTFATAKTYATYAQCKDLNNNTGTGSNTTISVSPSTGVPGTEGTLVKLACPSVAPATHPCKAVYYVGLDGKRHAFPNDKVFFTWYPNFNTVKDISTTEMSSYTLSKNVTYRPGSRMVKFTSVPFVYAVAKGGVLRWVKTEADASSLYGTDWNKKIDDINDALFSSYSYGTDVTANDPFNIQTELNGATTIDATL